MAVAVGVASAALGARQAAPPPPIELFFAAASPDDRIARDAMDQLSRQWRDSYAAMIVDLARQLRMSALGAGASFAGSASNPRDSDTDDMSFPDDAFGEVTAAVPSRESRIRARLMSFLEKQTRKRFDPYLRGWREWMWTLPYEPHPDYARFKGMAYAAIDPRMQRFFPPNVASLIRLDEVDWGGVTVNGIPPLYYPKHVPAADARFLRDSNLVFGVVINGQARAYPKRILAWHEMAIDSLGGKEITVVYCTLCGTVIPYDSVAGGRKIGFGTSGLLYRSNKLMFDEQTMSLWNTIDGTPVIGPLAGSGLQLTSYPAVTTTWGEWRALHSSTTVLSLDTGHKRDYSEGAAYRDYFSHDRLYFQVSHTDRRLKNKAEVLVMRVRPVSGGEPQPVAIVADFLKRTPVFHFVAAGRRLVALTTREGGNRVYALNQHEVAFPSQPVGPLVRDAIGREWRVSEDALALADGTASLPRYPAQRAFWFGWFAQYPKTDLLGLAR